MKKSEIAMLILIASVSIMVAFTIANAMPFLKIDQSEATVPTIEPISAEISDPDPQVFNKEAINPTVKTVIGGGSSNN